MADLPDGIERLLDQLAGHGSVVAVAGVGELAGLQPTWSKRGTTP